jgi:hypothetical protein
MLYLSPPSLSLNLYPSIHPPLPLSFLSPRELNLTSLKPQTLNPGPPRELNLTSLKPQTLNPEPPRELNLHFLAVEQHAFSLDMPDYLHMMHSPVTQEAVLSSCSDTLVSRLFTVCVTLSERPIIRYP